MGILLAGLAIALVGGWIAVWARQLATQGPDAQAAAGMYAAGDMFMGVAVFGVLALAPLGLGLYWMRPVARFWSELARLAVLYAFTGPLAFVVGKWFLGPRAVWSLLVVARVATMPLSALAFLVCALFAPVAHQRRQLLWVTLAESALFAGFVLVHLVLPHMAGR